jgi:hypothetical protein
MATTSGRLSAPRAAARARDLVTTLPDEGTRTRLQPLLTALAAALRSRSKLRAYQRKLRSQAAELRSEVHKPYRRVFPHNPWGVSLVDAHARVALGDLPRGNPSAAAAAAAWVVPDATGLRRRRRVERAAAAAADAQVDALLQQLPAGERAAAASAAEDLRAALRDVLRLAELVRQSARDVRAQQALGASLHQARFHFAEAPAGSDVD